MKAGLSILYPRFMTVDFVIRHQYTQFRTLQFACVNISIFTSNGTTSHIQ